MEAESSLFACTRFRIWAALLGSETPRSQRSLGFNSLYSIQPESGDFVALPRRDYNSPLFKQISLCTRWSSASVRGIAFKSKCRHSPSKLFGFSRPGAAALRVSRSRSQRLGRAKL